MLAKRTFITAALLALSTTAAVADYDTDYLVGTWSLEGKSECRNEDAERVIFSRDGGFRVYNNGGLESAGFWILDDKLILLHLVSSPHRVNPELTEYEGEYTHVVIDALPVRQKKDEFEVVARVEGVLEHVVLNRCP